MSELQLFGQWKQAPVQGVIPRSSPFDPEDERLLLESLTDCRAKLQEVLTIAQKYECLPDLEVGIGDALQGIHEAAAVVIEPKTYLE